MTTPIDPSTRLKLQTALIEYDKKQAKRKFYNRYALGIYLKALHQVDADVAGGMSLDVSLRNNFNDRLLTALERAVGLPITADMK